MYQIVTAEMPEDDDIKILREGIVGFNAKFIGESARKFTILLKDDSGNVYGGILAYQHSESIYIDILWIEEELRGQGYGRKLLLEAEDYARKQGCIYSTLDTYDFQAEKFYSKNGYACIGEIKDYIFEHSRIFLRKKLT